VVFAIKIWRHYCYENLVIFYRSKEPQISLHTKGVEIEAKGGG
jgi:hypothetical protein